MHQEILTIETALRKAELPDHELLAAREALDNILLKLPAPQTEKTLGQRLVPIGLKVMGVAADVQFLIMVNLLGKH